MKHLTSTAWVAGGRQSLAATLPHDAETIGMIETQPGFAPVLRRHMLTAVNTAARDLGLRPASVVVLDALMSCLPCQGENGQERPVTPLTLLTVYAGNETLCFRARGITDRQLRRHFIVLEKAGLIRRRDSANGKRFPVRRGGKVVGAYGIDLSPLFARSAEILEMARKRREEAEELRGLKARILRLRAACREMDLDAETTAFIDGLRNLLRRAGLRLVEARAILARLSEIISRHARLEPSSPAPQAAAKHQSDLCPEATADRPANAPTPASRGQSDPSEKTASDGQNVRHTEPRKTDTKKTSSAMIEWNHLLAIAELWPTPPRTLSELIDLCHRFGQMLGISDQLLHSAGTVLGWHKVIELINRLVAEPEKVSQPEAWLKEIIRSNTPRSRECQAC